MKKSLTLLLLCALCGSSAMYAKHVSSERASEIASKYVATAPHAPNGVKAKSVESLNENLYLVHLAPKGFAIVSADDNAEPVVAYSFESNLSPKSMPENMGYMLKEAAMGVEYKAKNGTTNQMWTRLENGYVARSRASESVDPLITVTWNQGAPYNTYCPGEGKNKAVVGCVAVAMSQAMSVQQSPRRPMGNMSYGSTNYGQLTIDFDKEPAYDWDAIILGKNNYDDVARLLWHAGMSVMMSYGVDGSGIPSNQVYRITSALKNTFGYNDVNYYARDSYRGDWEQLVYNELAAGNAVVYNAIDTQGGYGHSFNIDGYEGTTSKFHVNWGWGGTGNGYFNINMLKDVQMNMNYDSHHYCVTGIGASDSPLRHIELSDLIVEEDTPVGSPVAAILVNGEAPSSSMRVDVTGEYNSANDTFKDTPFEYKDGLLYIKEKLSSDLGKLYVRVQVLMTVEGKQVKLAQGFNVEVTPPQNIENRTSIHYDRASKMFKVHSKFGAKYVVKNSQGATIVSGTIDANPTFEFSRDQLTAGDNTIEVSSNGKSKVINISL